MEVIKKIILVLFLLILNCPFLYALEDRNIKGDEEFTIHKTIPAVILESTSKRIKGENIYFLDLDTDEPKILFTGNEIRQPFKKIYEDTNQITMQLLATGTGSIDTFIIDKTNGKFVRLSGGRVDGLYGDVSFGVCK